MICQNCGSDVVCDKYCSSCGVPMAVQYCPQCGSVMHDGDYYCSHCGALFQNNNGVHALPQGRGNKNAQAQYAYNQQQNYGAAGKKKNKKQRASIGVAADDKRTGFQTVVCFIFGLGSLALMGLAAFMFLMGDMFVESVTVAGETISTAKPAIDGAITADGSTAILSNYQAYIDYFTKTLIDSITNTFNGDGEVTAKISYLLINIIPQLLVVVAQVVALALIALAIVFGLIGFIVGMAKGKFFTLSKTSSLVLFSALLVMVVAKFSGFGDYLPITSGTMIGVIGGGAALLLCAIANAIYAGKRFFKPGSFFKYLTNAGICAGAVVAILNFPMDIIAAEEGASASISGIFKTFADLLGASDFTMPKFVIYAILLVLMLKCLVSLPRFVAKTGSRWSKTFKFDGYEDRSFILKSFIYLIGIGIMVGLAVWLTIGKAGGENLEINTQYYIFAAGAGISFICALLNRAVLNSDQK